MTKEQFFSDDIGDWVVETNKKYPNLTIDEFCKMFEEWFEDGINGFKNVEDEYKTVTFYDETGENCDIEISSIDELMSMITSIRVIKCDRKIID